ncbi:hypothetical protein C8R45DRAFT_1113262 [Mycena sanguinolenta]|nr:hypothetical protein C8R45DRAFT_1113262 [Mycena sanguinolenta]
MKFSSALILLTSVATTLAAVNGPCSSGSGVCISTSSCHAGGGVSATGLCPHTADDIKCCTKEPCGSTGGSCLFTSMCTGSRYYVSAPTLLVSAFANSHLESWSNSCDASVREAHGPALSGSGRPLFVLAVLHIPLLEPPAALVQVVLIANSTTYYRRNRPTSYLSSTRMRCLKTPNACWMPSLLLAVSLDRVEIQSRHAAPRPAALGRLRPPRLERQTVLYPPPAPENGTLTNERHTFLGQRAGAGSQRSPRVYIVPPSYRNQTKALQGMPRAARACLSTNGNIADLECAAGTVWGGPRTWRQSRDARCDGATTAETVSVTIMTGSPWTTIQRDWARSKEHRRGLDVEGAT